jgi:hypothetical protein
VEIISAVSRHDRKLSEIEIGGPHHFTSQMSDHFLLEWGSQGSQAQEAARWSNICSESARDSRSARGRTGTGREEALLNGDESDLLKNPIVEHYEHDPDAFVTLCSFDIGHFRRPFDVT